MLTPEELQRVGETLLPQLDTLNTWIVSDMIERFMIRFGRGYDVLITGTDAWQAWVLQQSGEQLDAVQAKLAKETGKTKEEIAAIFEEHGVKAIAADAGAMNLSFYRLSPVMMEIISDAYDRTLGEIKNLTRTTAGIANQTFIDIMDETYWRVRTGAQSYTAAVADAVLRLSKVQADVRYPSGHVDHLETAVLRAVRTGVSQSSGNCSLQLCKEYGWNHVLVSEHIGARVSAENPIADHAGWQGKVYCIEGSKEEYPNLKAATGYPDDPLGLCGYNCRHSFAPFLPGVSKNPYDGKHVDTEENRKAYALSQEQRRMERIIRAQKRKCAAQKNAIEHCKDPAAKEELKTQYRHSAVLLQKKNAAYAQFCKSHDLKPYYDRLAVAGWDRSQAAAASGAVKSAEREMISDFNHRYLAADTSELLRNQTAAVGIDNKLLGYSLNKANETGKHKAVVFQSALGYNTDNYMELVQEIRKGLSRYRAVSIGKTEYGEKFTVYMLVKGANGHYAKVKTGWIFDSGSTAPRMTTAYVDK